MSHKQKNFTEGKTWRESMPSCDLSGLAISKKFDQIEVG